MKRSLLSAMLIATVCAMCAWAQTSTEEPPAPPPVPRGAESTILIAVLSQHVDEVNFEDMPFEDVLEWLQRQGPINVVPQWKAMEQEGINRDTYVNVHLRNTTVREVLNAALEWLREGDLTRSSVTYQGMGNVLRISTKNSFDHEESFEVKVYDVTDILVRIPDFTESPDIDIESAQQGGQGGGGGSVQLFTGGGGQESDDEETDEFEENNPALDALRAVIEDTIASTTWDTYGGKAKIRVYNRQLVILNAISVHEKIGGRFVRD